MACLRVMLSRSLGRGKPAVLVALRYTSQDFSSDVSSEVDLLRSFTSPTGQPILAGRPYMPGSQGAGIPCYLSRPRDDFPSVVDMTKLTFSGSVSQALADSIKAILYQELPVSGVVLFRGLPIQTPRDLATFNKFLGVNTMTYEGGTTPRTVFESNVMTASEELPCFTIEPHNEMSYLLQSPTYISLFCEIPPEPGCGGEAVLVANREFQREINPEVKDKFKRLGIRHTHVYPSRTKDTYLSWQEVLEVDDRESAERVMINKGFSYQWHPDGSIAYWYHLPATRPHHSTGEEIWFNQVQSNASYFRSHPRWMDADIPDHMMPFHTYYGDGSAVDPNVIRHIRSVEWKHAVGMQPQKGDLLFLDNMLVQHGRLGYVGKRRLLVTLMSGL